MGAVYVGTILYFEPQGGGGVSYLFVYKLGVRTLYQTLLFAYGAVLRIRIHFIRIRIQHFRLNTDPDPDPGF